MKTSKSEPKRICVDLYPEDYRNLQHMKLHYGLEICDLVHIIISEIIKKFDIRDNRDETRREPITVTYEFNTQSKADLHTKPAESDHRMDATHEVSEYDYTYYPDEVKHGDSDSRPESEGEKGKKKSDDAPS